MPHLVTLYGGPWHGRQVATDSDVFFVDEFEGLEVLPRAPKTWRYTYRPDPYDASRFMCVDKVEVPDYA